MDEPWSIADQSIPMSRTTVMTAASIVKVCCKLAELAAPTGAGLPLTDQQSWPVITQIWCAAPPVDALLGGGAGSGVNGWAGSGVYGTGGTTGPGYPGSAFATNDGASPVVDATIPAATRTF